MLIIILTTIKKICSSLHLVCTQNALFRTNADHQVVVAAVVSVITIRTELWPDITHRALPRSNAILVGISPLSNPSRKQQKPYKSIPHPTPRSSKVGIIATYFSEEAREVGRGSGRKEGWGGGEGDGRRK